MQSWAWFILTIAFDQPVYQYSMLLVMRQGTSVQFLAVSVLLYLYSRTSIGKKREMSAELSALASDGSSTLTITKRSKQNVNEPSELDENENENKIVTAIDENTTNSSFTSFVGGATNKVKFWKCKFVFNKRLLYWSFLMTILFNLHTVHGFIALFGWWVW